MTLLAETAIPYLPRLSISEWVGFIVALYAIHAVAYAFLLSPVRHIPGPWWARISRLPLFYATYQKRRSFYASQLLRRYGPVVVVAPNQIHTTDSIAMQEIYSKTTIKTRFYSGMGVWKGVTQTLGFLSYKDAVPSRNFLIQCFQNRNLATLVESISSHIDEFKTLLKDKAKARETVDGVVIFRLLALDIVTDVLWGETHTLLSQMNDTTPTFLRRFHAFSAWNALKSFIPVADFYVRNFGNKKWRALRADCEDMDVTAREALERWSNHRESRREKDVLSMLQEMNRLEDKSKQIPYDHLPAYMVEMLAAGSSTTSLTAAFICYLLARDDHALKKLQTELFEIFPDSDNIDEKQMLDLPCLDAVIRETMRMYPMIPGPLERILTHPLVVAGKNIPAGVIASNAACDQGRLEDVYPEANKWKPERWTNPTQRMKLNWIPFGTGSRACPGSNLAMTELKYIIGTIFRHFRTVVPPGHESDTLELADIFAAGSRSGHCWLKFEEIEE